MTIQRYAIIVAGGSGIRMGTDVPKQFLRLKDKPILMHTILRFHQFDSSIQIIVVLPNTENKRWQELCREYNFTISHKLVNGGETRYHSVKNALSCITVKSLVAIHDGVRPLVNIDTIKNCFDTARKTGASIPVIECFESIRKIENSDKSISVDRSLYRMVQTPQVFNSEVLVNAYKQAYSPLFTDDASVVEGSGHTISLVEGNRENIKITTPLDLSIAEVLFQS